MSGDLHDALDEIGMTIDRIENANAMLQNGKSLPPQIHVEVLRSLLPEWIAELKAAHARATGRDGAPV